MVDTARDVGYLQTALADTPPGNILAQEHRDQMVSGHHDWGAGQVTDGDYFICSRHGSDSNPGTTLEAPFKTFTKAATLLAAGDKCYVRGGVYHEADRVQITVAGTEANRIQLLAYPGERPIIDAAGFSDRTSLQGLLTWDAGADWWVTRGLWCTTTTGVPIKFWTGFQNAGDNNEFWDCWASHNAGDGGFRNTGIGNRFYDCDSWYNYEASNSGESGDGYKDGGDNSHYENCRAWRNSDDGFEPGGANMTLINCKSWENGFLEDGTHPSAGDGNGFKYFQDSDKVDLYNCQAWDNFQKGFLNGLAEGRVSHHQCSAWGNTSGNFGDSPAPTDGLADFEYFNCWSPADESNSIIATSLQVGNSWGAHAGTADTPTFQDVNSPPEGYPYIETDAATGDALRIFMDGGWRMITTAAVT